MMVLKESSRAIIVRSMFSVLVYGDLKQFQVGFSCIILIFGDGDNRIVNIRNVFTRVVQSCTVPSCAFFQKYKITVGIVSVLLMVIAGF